MTTPANSLYETGLVDTIARKYDESLFEIFEKHGYSREKLMALGKEGKLSCIALAFPGGQRRQYVINDEFYVTVEFYNESDLGFKEIDAGEAW